MKPGSKCPNCKTAVKYGENAIDKDGNVICTSCKGVIFPVTEDAHRSVFTKMPVYEQYQHQKKDYELNPVT